jgi:predicted ATPase
MLKKIVITGGPGSGKTTLISSLKEQGHQCMSEISRTVTLEAQKQGIDQLFLEDPILFSEKLLEGRLNQFNDTKNLKKPFLFFDRGLPDITAYMDYSNTQYPTRFFDVCSTNRYDHIFLLPPWKEIYKQDNERYETFNEALKIHTYLIKGYEKYGYRVIEVPFGSIESRMKYIFNQLSDL